VSSALYIGLMSGTSLDGVDGVLVALPEADARALPPVPDVLGFVHHDYPAALRRCLLALQHPGAATAPRFAGDEDALHDAAQAAGEVARAYALVTLELLAQAGVDAARVRALGAHGQTVRHRPPGAVLAHAAHAAEARSQPPAVYSLQLLDAALLAELTGIAVVHDFRARDLAAGGQGAPLVPVFHAALFRPHPGRRVAVCNLGGMANVTLVGAAPDDVLGFDTGPGNALLDGWCARHRGAPYDEAGQWAASGRVDAQLLARLLDEPYFGKPPPKSTGRDLFDLPWLDARLSELGRPLEPADVQATLAELTAASIAQALASPSVQRAEPIERLWLCGGGAFNAHLAGRIAALSGLPVAGTSERGVREDQVEALAFAYLAQCHLLGRPGNLPAVTGARGLRVLGSLTPA
jgi:anhydro-N-acetylmuramic acid kinase